MAPHGRKATPQHNDKKTKRKRAKRRWSFGVLEFLIFFFERRARRCGLLTRFKVLVILGIVLVVDRRLFGPEAGSGRRRRRRRGRRRRGRRQRRALGSPGRPPPPGATPPPPPQEEVEEEEEEGEKEEEEEEP